MSRRRILLSAAAAVLAAALAFGLFWFEPWRLFTNTRVDEAPPTAAQTAPAGPTPTSVESAPTAPPPTPAFVPGPERRGEFISYEHATTGTAAIVEVSAAERYIRIENLDTSDGPDLRVYLSPLEHTAGMHAFGDGAVELGELKGNLGNQNYAVPADVDLADYRSVVIWCKRFAVAFGAAPLD